MEHKPIIEAIINTIAIALTAYGTQNIITGGVLGYYAITFALVLEFFKYWGRKEMYW